MEKFYIVTEESRLHNDYFEWKENAQTVNDLVRSFFEKHGIEAKEYYASNDGMYIVPTDQDKEKYKSVLCASIENGLQKFKSSSKINKDWVKTLEDRDIKVLHKPRVTFYVRIGGGRFRSRLFDQDGKLYCSFEPGPKETPTGFAEIKASEFFKVVEEAEHATA